MTKADCRSRLMEVGTRLFAERGLHGVSVRELSQAAGVSISMTSYYFGSKEGLYSSVLHEQFACFDQIEEIRRQGAGPLAVIEGYLRWTMLRHRNNPYLLRFYTSELTNPTAWFATIVSPGHRQRDPDPCGGDRRGDATGAVPAGYRSRQCRTGPCRHGQLFLPQHPGHRVVDQPFTRTGRAVDLPVCHHLHHGDHRGRVDSIANWQARETDGLNPAAATQLSFAGLWDNIISMEEGGALDGNSD